MKKIYALLIAVAISFIVLAQAAPTYAIDTLKPACDKAGSTQFCRNKNVENNRTIVDSRDSTLIRIARTIVLITGVASVVVIIIGGFKYVISNGDPNGVQGAKNTILYALVGLIVAAFAQVIVSFVLSRFT